MSEVENMVAEAKKPGVFKIVDAVKNRAYPTSRIEIFIDEDSAFDISELNDQINKISAEMETLGLDKKEIDKIMKRRDEILDKRDNLIESMGGTKYTFHLKGISEGRRNEIFEMCTEKYPIKYEKNRNALSGETEKVEIEEPQRDSYFTSLLWQAYIEKIVSPGGDEQVGISFEEAEELRASLPLAAITMISEGIEKMRAATALFMLSVNEDFLAKS